MPDPRRQPAQDHPRRRRQRADRRPGGLCAVSDVPAHQRRGRARATCAQCRPTRCCSRRRAPSARSLTLAAYEIVVVRYVKHCIGRAKPMITALIAFPLGHAVGQAMLSGGALRYRMYTPAGFTAMEVGATVLLCNLPYALAFGLLLDLALVFGARAARAAVPHLERVAVRARLPRARQGRGLPAASSGCARRRSGSAAGR